MKKREKKKKAIYLGTRPSRPQMPYLASQGQFATTEDLGRVRKPTVSVFSLVRRHLAERGGCRAWRSQPARTGIRPTRRLSAAVSDVGMAPHPLQSRRIAQIRREEPGTTPSSRTRKPCRS